jgi:5-methylcytosine-specific restriction protein B
MDLLDGGQSQARKNFQEVKEAADRGEDVTGQILLKLLPHTDSDARRQKGAWIYFASSTEEEDWSSRSGWSPERRRQLARAILHFVRRCNEQPKELISACAEFSKAPYGKELHTGILSPILSALRPNDFLLIDGNSLRLVNYFADTSSSLSLDDYPAANAAGLGLAEQVTEEISQTACPEIKKIDSFVIFLHWLTTAKKYRSSSPFMIHPNMYKHWPPMW